MTDHLAAIIAAAQCQRPVECRNGHTDWCNAARKVAVRDALREALGSAEVKAAAAMAETAQLVSYTLPANYARPYGNETHEDVARRCGPLNAPIVLAAAVAAVGGAS